MLYIKSKESCTGCCACLQICKHNAIKMVLDHEGFMYPEIEEEACIDCGMCEKVCHIISRQAEEKKENVLQTLVMRNNNDNILFNSSSGGVFFSVAIYILEQCHGVVAGAIYNEKMEVQHSICRTTDELPRLMGSKYVDSKLDNIFTEIRNILNQGTKVLFVGVPCQVNGLKKFLIKQYANLLTIDLFCYGGASPVVFRNYLKYLESLGIKNIADMNMRNKRYTGWKPGTSWKIRLRNGRNIYNDKRVPRWIDIFMSGLIRKPACANCQYTNTSRCGDLSIGDYWDRHHIHDELYSKKGTSVVLVNTKQGADIIKIIGKDFWKAEIPTHNALQPCLISPPPVNKQRSAFWDCYQAHGFKSSYEKFIKPSHPTTNSISRKEKLKYICINILTSRPWNFKEDLYTSRIYKLIKTIKGIFNK